MNWCAGSASVPRAPLVPVFLLIAAVELEELRALIRDVRAALGKLGGELPAQAAARFLDTLDRAQLLLVAHFAYTSHQWRTGSSSQSHGCTAAVMRRRKRVKARSAVTGFLSVIQLSPRPPPPPGWGRGGGGGSPRPPVIRPRAP